MTDYSPLEGTLEPPSTQKRTRNTNPCENCQRFKRGVRTILRCDGIAPNSCSSCERRDAVCSYPETPFTIKQYKQIGSPGPVSVRNHTAHNDHSYGDGFSESGPHMHSRNSGGGIEDRLFYATFPSSLISPDNRSASSLEDDSFTQYLTGLDTLPSVIPVRSSVVFREYGPPDLIDTKLSRSHMPFYSTHNTQEAALASSQRNFDTRFARLDPRPLHGINLASFESRSDYINTEVGYAPELRNEFDLNVGTTQTNANYRPPQAFQAGGSQGNFTTSEYLPAPPTFNVPMASRANYVLTSEHFEAPLVTLQIPVCCCPCRRLAACANIQTDFQAHLRAQTNIHTNP